jgi:hypothetical protein
MCSAGEKKGGGEKIGMTRATLLSAARRSRCIFLGVGVLVLFLIFNLVQIETTPPTPTVTLSAVVGNSYAKKCDAHVLDR